MTEHWEPVEADARTVKQEFSEPLMALAEGQVPAFVLRGAYPASDCAELMRRFTARGYFDRDTVEEESQLSGGPYLDLGTSLGRMGADPEALFDHADGTRELFPQLFEGLTDPVDTIYRNLQELAGGKRVVTAHEPDGRQFGPAIFRIYHGQEGHQPHIDSARRRAPSQYAVSHFTHQFAGVMCMQKGSPGGEAIIYRAKGEGAVEDLLKEGTFDTYAAEKRLPRVQVELDPGDLYFFYTENVHEVPKVTRDRTRVVLAVFVAMSPEADEVFVWS